MAKLSIVAGATSQSVNIFIQDSSSTTGAGLPGLVFNTSGLIAYYTFTGANATATAITLATLAAVNSAYSSGGFKEIDSTNMKGLYRLDVPNAALVTSKGRSVTIMLSGATNMAPLALEIELTGWDNQDAVHGGMSALPNTACTTNASLLTSGTGTDQISVSSGQVIIQSGTGTGQLSFASGVVKANLAQILGTALTETAGQTAAAFKKVFDVASPVFTAASVNQTGDNYARLGAPAGASVSADIAAVKTDSAAIKVQTDKITFTVANQVDANVLDWKSATAPAMTGDAYAALVTTTYAEPSAVPAATAKIVDMIHYLFTKTRNKSTQTATTQLIRNDADNATIATVTVSDDGTTFTKSVDT